MDLNHQCIEPIAFIYLGYLYHWSRNLFFSRASTNQKGRLPRNIVEINHRK